MVLSIDNDEITRLYVENGVPTTEIAKIYGCCSETIYYRLRNNGIKLRSRKEAHNKRELNIDENEIIRLYTIENQSTKKLAGRLGCSDVTIANRLEKHGIKRENKLIVKIDPKELEQEYEENGVPITRLAEKYGCYASTICDKLEKLNIKRRNGYEYRIGKPLSKEHREKLGGKNHPCWKGGISFEPYCWKFNEITKERIREKFGMKCYLCPTTEEENKIKLPVHHVDYNKNTLCNGKEWGLIPLCNRHHSKTNHNRWYWFNLLGNYWAMDATEIYVQELNGTH